MVIPYRSLCDSSLIISQKMTYYQIKANLLEERNKTTECQMVAKGFRKHQVVSIFYSPSTVYYSRSVIGFHKKSGKISDEHIPAYTISRRLFFVFTKQCNHDAKRFLCLKRLSCRFEAYQIQPFPLFPLDCRRWL